MEIGIRAAVEILGITMHDSRNRITGIIHQVFWRHGSCRITNYD
jgi:hypothetical protein